MKAITIWQPWASLIMIGAKPYEFRSRSYGDYVGGPRQPGSTILIQAGARKIRLPEVYGLLQQLDHPDDRTALVATRARPLLDRIMQAPKGAGIVPLGHALGTATLGEARLACDVFKLPVADSDRGQFNYAWPMTDVRPFVRPFELRGAQGFFEVPDSLVQEALAA